MSRERSPTSSSLQEPGTKLGLEGWGVGGGACWRAEEDRGQARGKRPSTAGPLRPEASSAAPKQPVWALGPQPQDAGETQH